MAAEIPASVRGELVELLEDLQHDLGKYLRMPLSFLPPNASPDEVRAAAHKALLETRTSPAGITTARTLWTRFVDACPGGALPDDEVFAALSRSVEAALRWEQPVVNGADVARADLERDLSAVSAAIKAAAARARG